MTVKTMGWARVLNIIAASFLVIGGLNWGLIGLFHLDLIAWISGRMEFGETNVFSRVIYSLMGVAAGVASYQGLSLKGIKQFWNLSSQEGLNVPAPKRPKRFITLPWNIPPREESKPKT